MTTTTLTRVIIGQYFHSQEKNQLNVRIEDAEAKLNELNSTAEKGWHWRVSNVNFIDDNGCEMSAAEKNAILKVCGLNQIY